MQLGSPFKFQPQTVDMDDMRMVVSPKRKQNGDLLWESDRAPKRNRAYSVSELAMSTDDITEGFNPIADAINHAIARGRNPLRNQMSPSDPIFHRVPGTQMPYRSDYPMNRYGAAITVPGLITSEYTAQVAAREEFYSNPANRPIFSQDFLSEMNLYTPQMPATPSSVTLTAGVSPDTPPNGVQMPPNTPAACPFTANAISSLPSPSEQMKSMIVKLKTSATYPIPTPPTSMAPEHLAIAGDNFRELSEDEQFVHGLKAELDGWISAKKQTMTAWRRQTARIRELLEVARAPDESEAFFLSGDEAVERLTHDTFFLGPIFTENQQPLPLQTIPEFLGEYYDDEVKVHIQDPSMPLSKKTAHTKKITIGELKERLSQPLPAKGIPINCLELATHVEDGLRPAFLNSEDARLLTKLKLPNSNDSASRRGYDMGWKDVEKWGLLAEAGALTEPHQDSHGYGTYITVNQGTVGFGWLANPTSEDRKEWRAHPMTFMSDKWRYVIMRPGKTVYFPSGTVHFVFRSRSAGNTLAFGGHVLRCSQIVRWVETMIEEKAGPEVTNEDLTVSAPGYLARVEKFVKQAKGTEQASKWGGDEAIERFLELKAEFLKMKKKPL